MGGRRYLAGFQAVLYFVGEVLACGFPAVVGEIGHGNLLSVTLLYFGNAQTTLALRSTSATVLFELIRHNNENLNETIGPTCESGPELKFILCIESPARP